MVRPWYKVVPLSVLMALAASPLFASPKTHSLVSLGDLHQAVRSAAATRDANVKQVEGFFSSPSALKALRSASLNPVEIRKAIPTLSNRELARLAVRTRKVQSEFAAGALTNQQLTYIVIAIGAVLITILIIAA